MKKFNRIISVALTFILIIATFVPVYAVVLAEKSEAVISDCNSSAGWTGPAYTSSFGRDASGSVGSPDLKDLVFQNNISPAINVTELGTDPALSLWVYIENVDLILDSQIELNSRGTTDDDNEINWSLKGAGVVSKQWTNIVLKLKEGNKSGSVDMGAINYMRIYAINSAPNSMYIDDVKMININLSSEGTKLSALSVTTSGAGALSPAFSPDKKIYSVEVPAGTENIALNAVPITSGATIKIVRDLDGAQNVESTKLFAGQNQIYVDVSLSGAATSRYEVRVYRPQTAAEKKNGILIDNGDTYTTDHSTLVNGNDGNPIAVWEPPVSQGGHDFVNSASGSGSIKGKWNGLIPAGAGLTIYHNFDGSHQLYPTVDITSSKYIEFDLYVNQKLEGHSLKFEISSSGRYDIDILTWDVSTLQITPNNWNHIVLNIADAKKEGNFNPAKLNWFRLWVTTGDGGMEDIVFNLDNIIASEEPTNPVDPVDDARVKSLTVKDNHELEPVFSSDKYDYFLTVPSTFNSFDLTYTTFDTKAEIVFTSNAKNATGAEALKLYEGQNQIFMHVTAQSGAKKVYVFNVFKKQSESSAKNYRLISNGNSLIGWTPGEPTASIDNSDFKTAPAAVSFKYPNADGGNIVLQYVPNGENQAVPRVNLKGMRYLEFELYVSDTQIFNYPGQFELTSSGAPDENEIAWTEEYFKGLDLKNGWNSIRLDMTEPFGRSEKPFSPEQFNFMRFYSITEGSGLGEVIVKFDNIRATAPTLEDLTTRNYSSCETLEGWSSNAEISLDNQEKTQGRASVKFVVAGKDSGVNMAHLRSEGLDIGDCRYLEFDLYLSNEKIFNKAEDVQFEIGSAGKPDEKELHWGKDAITALNLKQGWNKIKLPISSAIEDGGKIDKKAINFFRIYAVKYLGVNEELVFRIDNIRFTGASNPNAGNNGIVYLSVTAGILGVLCLIILTKKYKFKGNR